MNRSGKSQSKIHRKNASFTASNHTAQRWVKQLPESVGETSRNSQVVSPSLAIKYLREKVQVDSVERISLISVAGIPTYQVIYFSGHVGDGTHLHSHVALVDATTGMLRDPLTRSEAITIAKDHIVSSATITSVNYIEDVDGHHEYRERPLPAWAIQFSNPDCTAFISASYGTFQTVRHDQWRIFDFLWMSHTMDYKSRDDINNLLLKIFSICGVLTVISGFLLYFVSSQTFNRIQRSKSRYSKKAIS